MANDARRKRLAAWLLAAALLALGAAAGVAADRLVFRGPPHGGRFGPPPPEEVARRLTRELDLDDAQARAVRDVLEERFRSLGALFERIDPEADAIRRRGDDRIRALLEPAQRARFDERVAEQERRRAAVRERLGRAGATPGR